MVERRWPWLVSACLLLASGLATGRAAYLWWLPCRDAVSDGGGECLRRMGGGSPFAAVGASYPAVTPLMGLAMLAAAAAWLAIVVGLRWSWPQRLLLAPLVPVLALAGLRPEAATAELILLVDVAVVAAFVGTTVGSGPVVAGPDGVAVWRVWIPLGAVATFGMIWQIVDLLVLGRGYLGAVVGLAAAVATGVLALRTAPGPSVTRGAGVATRYAEAGSRSDRTSPMRRPPRGPRPSW